MKTRLVLLLFAALTISANSMAQAQRTSSAAFREAASQAAKRKADAAVQMQVAKEAADQEAVQIDTNVRKAMRELIKKRRAQGAASEDIHSEAPGAKSVATGTGSRPSSTSSGSGTGSRPSSTSSGSGSGSRPSSTASGNGTGTGSRPSSTSSSSNSGSRPSSTSSSSNAQSTSTTSDTGSGSTATGKRPSGTKGRRGSRSGASKSTDTHTGTGYGTAVRAPGSGTPVKVKSINELLDENAKYDSKVSLTRASSSEENLPPYVQSGDKVFILVKEEHNITDQSSDIFAANYENIYPGAIVYADAALSNGDPTLVSLPEGKVSLRVDFDTRNSSSTVKNVTNSADAVQDAIFKLIGNAKSTPAVSVEHSSSYSSSAEEMAVGLNVTAKFLNNSAKVKTNISKSEMHIYAVQNFTQKYYTISITQESDKSKYFGPNVTAKDLEGKMWKSRGDGYDDYYPLAIITSVTYGRRAYKIYDYSSSSFKFSGDESVSLYGQKMSSTQDIAESCETKNVWMYMDGADPESAGQILTGSSIDAALQNKLGFNPNTSQGVPLYYTVRFLASGNTANVQMTGKYTTLSYQELPTNVSVTFRNKASGLAGAALKMRMDYKVFRFDADGNKVGVPRDKGTLSGYNRYVERVIGFGRQKTFNLDLKDGEFLDGPIYLQIRCKYSASENYHEDISGEISPDRNGTIDISVDGNIRWGPAGEDAYVVSDSYTKVNNTRKD